MNHSNMYAVGLALCTFANIASEEMSRDLANEIEKLLGSSNTYIRKKVGTLDRGSDFTCENKLVAGCSLCPSYCQESAGPYGPFHVKSEEPAHRPQPRESPLCGDVDSGDGADGS